MNNIQKHGHSSRPLVLRNAMDRFFNESFWDPFASFFDMPNAVSFKADTAIDLSETEKEIIA